MSSPCALCASTKEVEYSPMAFFPWSTLSPRIWISSWDLLTVEIMSLCREDLSDIDTALKDMLDTGWPDVGNSAMGPGAVHSPPCMVSRSSLLMMQYATWFLLMMTCCLGMHVCHWDVFWLCWELRPRDVYSPARCRLCHHLVIVSSELRGINWSACQAESEAPLLLLVMPGWWLSFPCLSVAALGAVCLKWLRYYPVVWRSSMVKCPSWNSRCALTQKKGALTFLIW